MAHTCLYILSTKPTRLCGDPVRFKIVRDDDYRKVRKYNSFCDKHDLEVRQQRETECKSCDGDGRGWDPVTNVDVCPDCGGTGKRS